MNFNPTLILIGCLKNQDYFEVAAQAFISAIACENRHDPAGSP